VEQISSINPAVTKADMPKIEPGLPAPPELDADQMAAIAIEVAAASGRALRAGSMAPAFRLRDHGGRQVSLQELSATGPAIVHFYRGSWCTYCHDGLTDLAAAHDEIRAAAGRVVAIAPLGTIVLGAVDVDYRNRPHSEQLLIALEGMRRRGSA
jgi:thiol-disulfide isomerase/thioredoxin